MSVKKIISAVLVSATALGFQSVVFAKSTENVNNTIYTYSVNGDSISIDDVETEELRIIVPKQLEGKPVTVIGEAAFRDCLITSVELPDTITTISDYAFEFCDRLTSVNVPANVESIGRECFSGCSKLENVTLPSGLKNISEGCFGKCVSLTEIEIPEGVTKIDTAAFNGCTALISINIPDSVTDMGNVVFYGDKLLGNIEWNKNISSIGKDVFENTKFLANYPEDYLLLNNGELLYKYVGGSGSVKIPDSVTQISKGAFANTSISAVELPSNMTEIPSSMFMGCEELKSIIIPESVIGIGGSAFKDCKALEDISFPDSLQYINGSAFSECSSLKKVSIPDGVTKIGSSCFMDCMSLYEVRLPSGLQKLGDKAFYNCDALKMINIPAGISETITEKTFSPSAYLEKVTIEGGYTKALANALAIAHWYGGSENIWNITDGVLMKYNGTDTDVTIPKTVTEIGKKAFANGAELTSVVIPDTVTRIGDAAFYGQSEIIKITIPGSVTSIGQMAFADCASLKTVVFESGDSTLALGKDAFRDTAVTSDTLIKNNRNILNIESAFANTAIYKEDKKTIEYANTESSTVSMENAETIDVKSGDKTTVEVNNKSVVFPDAQPFIDENGRTQIPIRAVAEALGCAVEWDGTSRTATITKDDTVIIIAIGREIIQVGKELVTMDTAAEIKDERTYIPVRFVGEALGMTVNWVN